MSEIDFSAVETPPQADSTPAPSPTPESATPAPEQSAPNYAALDALLPDSEDLDEDLRGRPIKDVLRVAKQHKEEAKQRYDLGLKVNNLQTQLEMATRLIGRYQQPQQAMPEPDPQQFLNEFAAAPQRVLPRVVNEQVAAQMQPVLQELQTLKASQYQAQSELARAQARGAIGATPEQWDKMARPLAAIIWANGGDPQNPEHWRRAHKEFIDSVGIQAPPVPKQGTPPVGQARSTPTPANAAPRLSARDEQNLAELASMFGVKKGSKAFEQLVKDVASDPTAMGSVNYE